MSDVDYRSVVKPGLVVGIIDADLLDNGTRHPNLALMKLSGYCKDCDCAVRLLMSYDDIKECDIVFVSKVFTFTWVPDNLAALGNVYVGGTGFYSDGGPSLPNEIEHHMPDYKLYVPFVEEKISQGRARSWYADYLDYSIGFTTRGCFRKCSFCVNQKYDHAFRHSPVSEFLDEERPCIYLWDDNVLAYAGWREVFDELDATGKPYQFRQGLDISLLNKEKAERLAKAHYIGDFIFAFDHLEDRDIVEKNLAIWRSFTTRGTRLYVLCAYDSQDEKDIESVFSRIVILMKYGCLPYIMRYETYKQSKWRRLYVAIARWCNQPQFFKKMSFRQFCEANQQYHKNKETKCSALQALDDFEAEFPEIASTFFDVRYEEQNMFIRFGRKFFGRPLEDVSEIQRENWQKLKDAHMHQDEILTRYFDKDLDIVWAEKYSGGDFGYYEAQVVFDAIDRATLDEIFECVCSTDYKEPITPDNIPQFSSIEAVRRCANFLRIQEDLYSYESLGKDLCPNDKKQETAHKKFGENHGKTAALLDLAYVERDCQRVGFGGTLFAGFFAGLDDSQQACLVAKLSLRISVIRQMLVAARTGEVTLGDYLAVLSESTKVRRKPNVVALLDIIEESARLNDREIIHALSNIRRQL